MFQPHSVRGLLSRRSNTHTLQDKSQLQSHKDPDLESTVQAKLMIKDIEHQIDDIRQWRQHQKILLEERLASNKAVADVMMESYKENSEKDQYKTKEQTVTIINKLQKMTLSQANQKQYSSEDTNIFDYITDSNKWVEEIKHETKLQEGVSNMAQLNMISEIEGMGELVFKNLQKHTENSSQVTKKQIDKQKLKKQLQQIDAQLKEVQGLLSE